jgi:acid phosphatase (class A)
MREFRVPLDGARRCATIGVLLFLAGCATSHRASTSAPVFSGPWQIPPPSAFLAHVPPPPRPDSEAQHLDVDTVLALQARATPARIARAHLTYDFSIDTFAKHHVPGFDPAHYPRTIAFFHRLNDIVEHVNDPIKDHYRRPHPFQVDPRIHEYVVAPPGYSYPSYHSARCAVFRRTLDHLDPAHARLFERISREVEKDRVFAGEHFPTDIDAGSRLGHAIFEALEKDPTFRADLARLKQAEWTPPPRFRPTQ